MLLSPLSSDGVASKIDTGLTTSSLVQLQLEQQMLMTYRSTRQGEAQLQVAGIDNGDNTGLVEL